jgi:small subunit ribosomal protein S6
LEKAAKKLYEAMFLVDSALATADWDGLIKTIKSILQRADAEIVSITKWGERKLAYEISHKSRGTYILCYFKAQGSRIRGIERDVQLSERIMRVLVLSAEKQNIEGIREPASEESAQEPKAELAEQVEQDQVPAEPQAEQVGPSQ